ncbi:MAG: DNA mismatch repair endonuclease MutL [Candidatus Margulisbacteria bacterium]|jgi:DNA mismatch repair protein MutL|nr:DNA mismatch repair endonuclease MutL [Candidatus Margulisiibacteriota bacterium]
MTIKLLPDDLINKIAAGEVIERPASVVKELVENSLDAGATRVMVEVQEAGKKLISVADNGSGMTEAETKLALQRHSTSKITSADDLFAIKTLGFRGEALPSIASVAKMELAPNPAGQGLTAEVKTLFYNTPARKKFLKSNATEMGHIGDIIAKYALARPAVAFRLTADGKVLLNSPGTGNLLDAVLAVYGPELTRELVPVDHPFRSGRVHGLISRPTISRLDKNYETFFVNGRYVKNFLLNRALEEAYRTLIPNGRYPVAILFVEIDPAQVDVNVHPTKREVKFADNTMVMQAVREAVQVALEVTGKDMGADAGIDAGGEMVEIGSNDQLPISGFETGLQTLITASNSESTELSVDPAQPLTPIYQLMPTYIVATDGRELVLIDQHAAHERTLYDQLSGKKTAGASQILLVPETIELSVGETLALMSNLDNLKCFGFEIAEFGSNSFIVRAVPAVSAKIPAKQLLHDIVTELLEEGGSTQLEVKKENIRKLVACHSAIKAGERLTPLEMAGLIRALFLTENPLTCPHGRPTMIRISQAELTKMFGR